MRIARRYMEIYAYKEKLLFFVVNLTQHIKTTLLQRTYSKGVIGFGQVMDRIKENFKMNTETHNKSQMVIAISVISYFSNLVPQLWNSIFGCFVTALLLFCNLVLAKSVFAMSILCTETLYCHYAVNLLTAELSSLVFLFSCYVQSLQIVRDCSSISIEHYLMN